MDEKRARKILGDVITDDDGLFEGDPNACAVIWDPTSSDPTPELNGHFTADELEAISWWIRNKRKAKDKKKKSVKARS